MKPVCLFLLCAICQAADLSPIEPMRRIATVKADPSSGRLVRRTVMLTPKVLPPLTVKSRDLEIAGETVPNPGSDALMNEIIEATAKRHEVDPLLVHSVIQVESAYNKYAISSAGAQGVMQLIPSTARSLGVKNPFDPKENIEAGVRYLKQLQTMFKDDRLALAAYNSGPGAVTRYGTIPPYQETQNYVYQVGRRLGQARRATSQKQLAAKSEESRKIEQFVDGEGRQHLRMR